MINVIIDEFTPCLKESATGRLVDTEVIRIRRKSFLSAYSKKNGWFVNWADLADNNEIYALVLKGTVDIQGLVALTPDAERESAYINWMCAAPENNKLLVEVPKYVGVGGHLFAIAAYKSLEYGFDGFIYGFAANADLVKHYVEVFNAQFIGMLHPYHIMISDTSASKIMEAYDYEWTDEEI